MGSFATDSSASVTTTRSPASSPMPSCTMIHVTICVPEMSLRREMRVNTAMPINTLKKYIPSGLELVFRGALLSENMPLTYYSIGDGDILIAYNSTKTEAAIWLRMTEDYESFVERMKITMNPKLSYALARVRDLRMLRISERPGMFNIMKSFYECDECERKNMPPMVIVPPGAHENDSPNCDPLPILWEEEAVMNNHKQGAKLQPVYC